MGSKGVLPEKKGDTPVVCDTPQQQKLVSFPHEQFECALPNSYQREMRNCCSAGYPIVNNG